MELRLAIRINAALSLFTGSALSVAPGVIGGWLGVEIDLWLRILGLALIGHGAILVSVAGRATARWWARINLAIIGPYPLLMVLVAVTGLVSTGVGRGVVLADGALVGLLAVAQWSALRTEETTVTSASASTSSSASPAL